MPEQFTITGTIIPANDTARAGIRVQAFDRDLPSRERRGAGPQLLGEATADAEGRFQMTYTLGQFNRGEGMTPVLRLRERNADLSFRVFDETGQALSIKSIQALGREFTSEQIIFNVPASLEVVIFMEAPAETGDSEYEQLVALFSPVIEEVPLVELTDEDVVFLIHELGLEQRDEVRQRLEWLRRCALLARETSLPIEAFYGWGRKDVPALFAELAAIPVKELPQVMEKLVSLPDQQLRQALPVATEENIIPTRFRDRADAMAYAIRRRALKERVVRLRLEREPTGEPLTGYTVTTFDADANNRDLGTDVTDALGEFTVAYFADAAALDAEHNLRFRVRGPAITEDIDVTKRIRPDASAAFSVRVLLPGVDPTLQQLRRDGHIEVPDEVLEMIEQTAGIRSFADIRRRGGLGRIKTLKGLDSSVIRYLDALADLDRLSSDPNETSVLLAHRFDSVLAIAETPRKEFIAAVGAHEAGLSDVRATQLHVAAKAQTDFLAQVFAGIASDSANGFESRTSFASGLDNFSTFTDE
jgi:hypothetical protein